MFEPAVIMTSPPARRYSLRARDRALLSRIIGLPLPARIGDTVGGTEGSTVGSIACLGPDEYYARLSGDIDLEPAQGQPVSIVDISDRAVGFTIEGAGALDLLSSGCPLDLARFAVGRTTRTLFETVEIIITREADRRWHVDVWRSFAPWLRAALDQANLPGAPQP
jgi:sarcosine oxidase, subunit gamma